MAKLFLILLMHVLCLNYSLIQHRTTTDFRYNLDYDCKLCSTKSIITVPAEDYQKKRLDVYLSDLLGDHSRSYYGNLCEKGRVLVNQKIQDKAYKISKGDVIEYEIDEKPAEQTIVPENIPLDILFEDKDIICINKPSGMVVHPAPGSPNGTFVNGLLYHLGDEGRKLLAATTTTDASSSDNILTSLPLTLDLNDIDDDVVILNDSPTLLNLNLDLSTSSTSSSSSSSSSTSSILDLPETPEAAKASPVYLRPGVVHRLDKGTTGVLLAAKHNDAVAKLSYLFAARQVHKMYLAICVGHPGEATILEPIGRSLKNRQMMTVYDGPPGKMAITHVNTIAFDGKLSACLVRIETGRTHQIRVHMKHRRTPIVGDETYGNADWNQKMLRAYGINRPLLHAYETKFIHPFTGESLTLRAPLPTDMRTMLSKLSIGLPESLIDENTGYLTCPIEAKGKLAGEKVKGFVPFDRLAFEEEHWTSFDLPEEEF